MGGFFSIDSFSCSKNVINDMVFSPPNPPSIKSFYDLEKSNDKIKIKKFKTNDGHYVFGIEITPNINKYISKVLIFSHGNGEDVYQNFNLMKILSNTLGITVLAYDYPGYGLSTGTATENNCYESLDVVIQYYQLLNKKILLVGRSLGSGVTVECAVRQNNWKYPIILISAYKSIPRVILDYPIESTISHFKFESIYKVDKLKCPVKLIHGTDDNLIPYTHSEDLYVRISNKKYPPTYINGAGHNNIFDFAESISEIKKVVDF